jgi:hypothetical protein
VITALLVGAMFVVALVVVGVVVAMASILGFVISLPFRILGWTIKLLGLLFAVPFLVLGAVIFGGGVLAAVLFGLLLPLAPVVGFAWLVWWLATRNDSKRSHAGVVS